MKKACLLAAFAVVVAPMAFGDSITFTNTTGLIEDAANWSNGQLPVTGTHVGTVTDIAVQNNDRAIANDLTVTFAGSASLENLNGRAIRMGGSHYTFNDTSSFDVSGENMIIGYDTTSSITWNSSGSCSGALRIDVGRAGAPASVSTLTQTAGSIDAGSALWLQTGVFTISGGTMTARGLSFNTGTIDFLTTGTTGIVSVAGYTVAAFQTAIAAGQITLDGVAQGTDYSGFYITNDRITVIPEPATLGLVIAMGGSMLFFRRRMRFF